MSLIAIFFFCIIAVCYSADHLVGLYYFSPWNIVNLHYRPLHSEKWTPLPGIPFSKSTNPSFNDWYYIVVNGSGIEFVTNNNNEWDNNGGKNYHIASPGVYALKNGLLSKLTDDCPQSDAGECSGHGKCIDDICSCQPSFFGFDCSLSCPESKGLICSGHGKCTFDGKCDCEKGWGCCTTDCNDCNVSFSNSTTHCGGCNRPCTADKSKGVASAKCTKGECKITCLPDLQLCSDNTCRKECPLPPLPGCDVYQENQCSGKHAETDPKYASHTWQTPRNTSAKYLPSYEGLAYISGYASIKYNSELNKATVKVISFKRDDDDTIVYCFNQTCSPRDSIDLDSSFESELVIILKSSKHDVRLTLDPINFVWNLIPVLDRKGDFRGGQKGAIVELFGWPYEDVEKECGFLGSAGYLGVKVFPPTETLMSTQPFNTVMNPWYFMYQPVSYRFQGRWGSRSQLKSMINTCRKYGVRVYFDAVINHMTGSGNDIQDHRNPSAGCSKWGNKTTTGGLYGKESPFFTQGWTFQPNENSGKSPQQEFPAVPYSALDFHCEKPLNSWTDPFILNSGWLSGLVDLNTEREYVQQRIADFIVEGLSLGFSGIRVDAAKHISPSSLANIFGRVARGMGGKLPSDFIAWLEVLFGGELDMLLCNDDSGYNYGRRFAKQLSEVGLSPDDVKKIKIWDSAYPTQPAGDCVYDMLDRMVAQNDDHDQQMPGSSSRDMHDRGCVLVKDCEESVHRAFETRLFMNPYGVTDNNNQYPIRLVLSSFYWYKDSFGIPDGFSDCSLCTETCEGCKSVPKIPAYSDYSSGYDKDYTRVHRDFMVVNAMRSWMKML
ncbi:hypothetical protein GEMRC1_006213 [Eukaryota sp. GEM-RC1]